MSFEYIICRRVAVRQSLPPLHRLVTILNNPLCRTMIFQRTATIPLTSCLSPRVHSKPPPSPAPHPQNQIPHNLQESLRTSGKSNLLNPVRFGQLAHEPASGTSVSSCLSNGADASCSKMFDSIHAASSRTGIR